MDLPMTDEAADRVYATMNAHQQASAMSLGARENMMLGSGEPLYDTLKESVNPGYHAGVPDRL